MRILVVILQLTCAVWLSVADAVGFEGFGSGTPGGNDDTVVTVTSLGDSGTGTLRAALSGSHRHIVFSVSGTINLQSALQIRDKSFITIDGSTAPGAGITLKGNGFYIRNSHDIIITHMRIRDSAGDGITLWDGSYNVVIDHCSVTNSADGNIDITENTRNVTVSWSILGDTRSNSFQLKTKGMLVANFDKPAVTNLSLHHNLFINLFQRNPQISTAGLVDIRNNVIRDWGAYGIRMRAGAWGNIINNAFDTNNNPEDAVVLESTAGAVYIDGNLGPGSRNVNTLSTAAAAFTVAPVSTDAADDVEQEVFPTVGAFPRDSIDTLLAGSVQSESSPTNQPPTAAAGLDQTAEAGATVTLDGRGSADPDGDPLSYQWNFGDGSVASGAVVTHSYNTSGVYTATLTVGDGKLSDSDSTLITVTANSSCGYTNLARCATASASSIWSSSYSAAKANDGKTNTRWISAPGTGAGSWLALNFGAPTTFDTVVIREAYNRITGYSLQSWDGSAWRDIVTGTTIGSGKTHIFSPVTTERVRILISSTNSTSRSVTPTLREFEVYK
jgi:pectate lyase